MTNGQRERLAVPTESALGSQLPPAIHPTPLATWSACWGLCLLSHVAGAAGLPAQTLLLEVMAARG